MVWKEVKIELSVQFFYKQQNDDIIHRLQRPHQGAAETSILFSFLSSKCIYFQIFQLGEFITRKPRNLASG